MFWAIAAGAADLPVFKDPKAPMEKRVDDLVSRLTLEEKAAQLMNNAPAIPRLGVPAYNWWNECLHGVARAGRATVFPEPIGLAATWDQGLTLRVATAISDEARAKHHEFVRRGKRNIYQGLTFWTPNINLFRDPRWGRGMETYGEDPYLTGKLAAQFIRGLQGDDPKYLKTVATAKHFAVHSGPESGRHSFDSVVSEADLRDTYLPQFEMAVKEGGAFSVMCSYNKVDGVPACANQRLLQQILRDEWKFPGYVVSDCGAIGDIFEGHKFAPTAGQGAVLALKAGTDLACGNEYMALVPAVKQGLIKESEIDTAVKRLFLARFRLGMFDPREMVAYSRIPYSENDSVEHRALALEAARKSIVLLKNDDGVLPLKKNVKTIAVIGPNADDVNVMLGNYNGDPSSPVTPLEGIRRKLGPGVNVLYARGSDLAENMPLYEVVPASALFTTGGPDRQPGLKAEYFAHSDFDGQPHSAQEKTFATTARPAVQNPGQIKPVLTRIDAKIDFQWWDGSPDPRIPDDDIGVRWTGFLAPPVSGTYRLGGYGFNAWEITLGGKPVAQSNNLYERNYEYGTVELQAGKLYPITVQLHNFLNDANMKLVWAVPGKDYAREAIETAKKADVVTLFLGLSPRLEGEEMKVPVEGFAGGDRVSLNLPKMQEDLLKRIVELHKPTVLVLMNGSSVAVNYARDNVKAIVDAWYPGQAGGTAIADVLFGDYNPAGRLPVTFYKSADQLPPFTDYSMRGRTYRYFQGEPLFPFGYGLSYTRFTYGNLHMPATAPAGGEVKVSVEVRNAGQLAGEEVVQLYLKNLDGGATAPIRSLQGFERIALEPGEKKQVEFRLSARQFSSIGEDQRRSVTPGRYEISVGGQQPGFQGRLNAATTAVATQSLRLTGETNLLD
ncbi:MAG: glycoside hydrolase family 3 C-terminal domain-containing protein [Bryobacteraceae bacterium]|nr:glycoside hydrolase family 3 C-terminal domain-containing protein [Bryobacteraceae bacterium]